MALPNAYLLDRASGELVEAEVLQEIGAMQIQDWHTLWKPSLSQGLINLHANEGSNALPPQSKHWNWQEKSSHPSQIWAEGFSVVCGGETQGMMLVNLVSQHARLSGQEGKHLVYVEYVEVAPWNRARLHDPVRYKGVGTLLIASAIEKSFAEDCKGRVGLHALPQSAGWYESRLGMTNLGEDKSKQNLPYFEISTEQAIRIRGRRSS